MAVKEEQFVTLEAVKAASATLKGLTVIGGILRRGSDGAVAPVNSGRQLDSMTVSSSEVRQASKVTLPR